MSEETYFSLVTSIATLTLIALVFMHIIDWDIRRQRQADLEFQHGGGIRHTSGCSRCARTHITIKKKPVYEPKHSKHVWEQNRR